MISKTQQKLSDCQEASVDRSQHSVIDWALFNLINQIFVRARVISTEE